MRIVLVSHHAPPHVGGLENLVALEARALVEDGHEVVWITSTMGGKGSDPEASDRLRVERVATWNIIEHRWQIAYPIFSPRLLAVLWRELGKADLLHAHGFLFTSTCAAMMMATLRRTPAILTDHGGLMRYRSRIITFALNAFAATFGRLNCLLATRLVAYNQRNVELLDRMVFCKGRTMFLPNPVDRDVFSRPSEGERATAREALGWVDGKPRVLFVGRVVPDKGVDTLLDLACGDFELVFCGPANDAMQERIAAAGAEYLSPRPQSELRALYHAADVFALPSWNEGFPVVIQEALACGLPVVTSDDPGYAPYRELPDLTLCDTDVASMKRAIRALLSKREQTTSSGEAPRCNQAVQTTDLVPTKAQWVGRLLEGVSGGKRNE